MPNGNSWNVDANIAASRESFPVGDNDVGKEFNDVGGRDPSFTKALPDYDYSPSLNEVKDLGNLKKGGSSSFIKKAAIGGATLIVTAASLLSTINSAKPTISEEAINYSSYSLSYSMTLTYTKTGTLYLKVVDEKKNALKQEYSLPWDDTVVSEGTKKIKKIEGAFDTSSLGKSLTITISADNGYGTNQLDKKTFINE